MEKQYLNPETYIKVIDDLSTTISNLHIESALLKAQYEELTNYTVELQQKLECLDKKEEKVDE